jgi:hypothetical protein
MSDEGKPLSELHILKKIVWRSTISGGSSMEQFTTWTITGVAAIVGLIITNLGSLATIVSLSGLRAAIILFVVSLIFGAISKQAGMALASGLQTISEVEGRLYSDAGRALIVKMAIPPQQLGSEFAEPFIWPLSALIRKRCEQSVTDYLRADKTLVRVFCFQLCMNWLHSLFAVIALLVLAFSL